MALFWISLLLLLNGSTAFGAYQHQLIPVICELKSTPKPSVSEWNAYVRVADYDGVSYVPLVQVAELLNGHLRWHTVAKNVEFSVHGQKIRFPYYAAQAWINGRAVRLEHQTVKNEDGFWVPVSFFASKEFYKATKAKLVWPPPTMRQGTSDKGQVQEESEKAPVASRLSHGRAIKRIVIDPGHGGKDPGAIGRRGTEEKMVNLRLAQELAETLRESYGYEVLLTRMEDTFVPLEQRSKLANKHDADLFISLHCNASKHAEQKGFEVYFLSETASDSSAAAAAQLENAALALEGKEVPSPSRVKAVLRSLVKTANINEASAAGSLIDRHLAQKLYEPSLGVKQAAFYVLRGAEMPAVLIETAFISNPREERLLNDEDFIQKLVDGIAAGVVAYDKRKQKERQ